VKVALGSGAAAPTRTGAVTLNTGENTLRSGVIDAANGYAYFGTSTSPGQVVKVALGSGAATPTRTGAVTLDAGENSLCSAVIDAAAGYAYFGTDTWPGLVVKVALGSGAATPTRTSAVTLNTGESNLYSAVIDAANGYAYFGTNTSPGRVVKVALGSGTAAPTRTGAVTLNTGESSLYSAVIDAANGYAYFGTQTSPSCLVRVAASHKGCLRATKMTLPEVAASVDEMRFYSHAAAGNLRLALYDNNEPKNLLWESGAVANTAAGADLAVAISAGTPSSLAIPAGTYWLAWQTDSASAVASYTAGSAGDGFLSPLGFGAAPASLASEALQNTSERWTQYVVYRNETVPPTVASVNVAGALEVDVTFSEALEATGATTPANYALSGTGKGTLAGNPTSAAFQSGTTYRCTWPSGDMVAGGDITVTVTGVVDTQGNPIGSPNSATHTGGGLPVTLSGLNLD
jgi:hypothetical protein